MEKPAPTEYALEPVIARRWSPRAYDPERSVSESDLLTCLEAARWAPSSANEQPWRFLVFDQHVPDELQEARECLNEGNAWARQAPVLILSVAKQTFTRHGKPNRHAGHDTGAATQNLLLQVAGLGLFGHPMAGFDADKTRAYFGIPEDFVPMAMIAVGYYGVTENLAEKDRVREPQPRSRLTLAEIAFRGGWNRPVTG